MKFINLDNGYSFDALWTETQSKGYTFWFPNEQSTGLTYVMTIAFTSDSDDAITLSIEDNDVFSFISHNSKFSKTIVDGYEFDTPIYSKTLSVIPENVNGKNIYHFNVACCSNVAGEYICKIKIGDEGYIKVGADLYGEYEPVYVNLSNFGVEIPSTVQKAIYDSNVHEDMTDHILVNRKFKELLSNYWDIIANKGSYKSLNNALQWFEWDDNLKMKEIWRHYTADKSMFNDKDITDVFESKLEKEFINFSKTTYISLYCSMQDELDTYDSEYNPALVAAVLKWSREDLQLKLSLLAQFLGVYFLPIHMSIFHAALEDVVFTNTIKSISAGEIRRQDNFGDFTAVECNIKDDDVFLMRNVRVQVSDDTVFGVRHPDEGCVGVDTFPSYSSIGEDELKTFSSQYYTGPGAVIPIHISIPNQTKGDFISKTIMYLDNSQHEFYDIFRAGNGKIDIKFNFLAKFAGKHIIRMTFVFGSGKIIGHNIHINVENAENIGINIYKIKSKDDKAGLTKKDFLDMSFSKYLFKIQKSKSNSYYTRYLPYMSPSNEKYENYNGVKLTRTVVVDMKEKTDHHYINVLKGIMHTNFLEFEKCDSNGNITYMIFVSKHFNENDPDINTNKYGYKYNIIRNDLGFYPQFHYIEKMDGNSIDDFTFSQYDALCCAAEINDGKKIEEFKYGHLIEDSEWSFTNATTGYELEYPGSSLQPFIADETNLENGYYDVRFKYSLTDGQTNECYVKSAFRIKNI